MQIRLILFSFLISFGFGLCSLAMEKDLKTVTFISHEGDGFQIPLDEALKSEIVQIARGSALSDEKASSSFNFKTISTQTMKEIAKLMWSAHEHKNLRGKRFLDAVEADSRINYNNLELLKAAVFLEIDFIKDLFARHFAREILEEKNASLGTAIKFLISGFAPRLVSLPLSLDQIKTLLSSNLPPEATELLLAKTLFYHDLSSTSWKSKGYKVTKFEGVDPHIDPNYGYSVQDYLDYDPDIIIMNTELRKDAAALADEYYIKYIAMGPPGEDYEDELQKVRFYRPNPSEAQFIAEEQSKANTLDLGYRNIKDLFGLENVPNILDIEVLDVRYNRLVDLPVEVLRALKNLKRILIRGNPLANKQDTLERLRESLLVEINVEN